MLFCLFCLWKLHISLQWKLTQISLQSGWYRRLYLCFILWNFFENKSSPQGEENFESFWFFLLSVENASICVIFTQESVIIWLLREMWYWTKFRRRQSLFSPVGPILSSSCHVCVLSHFSCVWLFETPWTVTLQSPLSMEFSWQE